MTEEEARQRIREVLTAADRLVWRVLVLWIGCFALAVVLAVCGVSDARAWISPVAQIALFPAVAELTILFMKRRILRVWGRP